MSYGRRITKEETGFPQQLDSKESHLGRRLHRRPDRRRGVDAPRQTLREGRGPPRPRRDRTIHHPKEYFDMKITEQDIMEAKIEAREEGRAEGEAKGRAEGRAERKAEGKAEGRSEGRIQGRIDTLKQALDNLKGIMDAEAIVKAFNISETERKALAL